MKVFRRTYTKPKPPDAKILRRRSGLVAQWTTRGRMQEAKITTSGDRVLCQSKCWYLSWTDGGIVHEIKALPDEQATRDMAAMIGKLIEAKATGKALSGESVRWLRSVPGGLHSELVRVGLAGADRRLTGGHTHDIDDLIDLWQQHLIDGEKADSYVPGQVARVRRALLGAGFRLWCDIDHAALQSWLTNKRAGGVGISKGSYAHYVQACRQFTRYASSTFHLGADPLADLTRLSNIESDPRHPRRILEPSELAAVIDAAESGPSYWKMSGPARGMLYRVMASTGLRLGECIALRVCDLSLSGTRPSVTVRAAKAKSRKPAVLPLSKYLRDRLVAFTSAKLPTAAVFTGLSRYACDLWQKDCETAGVEYVNAAGEYADLHALRHYYGTRLAESGLNIHEVKSLMRHGSITTTARYMHAAESRMREAVENLPEIVTSAG